MEFEWDGKRHMSNVEKHGFDLLGTWKLFEEDHIEGVAKQGKDGEGGSLPMV